MKILKRIYATCVSFNEYEKIISEPRKNAFLYFFFIVFVSSILIYPKYFDQKKKILFPLLDTISKEFPVLQFKGGELVSKLRSHLVINNPFLSIVIDPEGTFKQDVFPGPWLLFNRNHLQFNYSSEQQNFSYNNTFIAVLFTELAGFNNGSGVLDGNFFIKLQEVFKKTYLLNGVIFLFNFVIISIVINFVFSLIGQLYSKIIYTSLVWKDVRILSHYAITPVLLTLILAYYLNLDVLKLQPVFLLAYILFLIGAIHKFKKPVEESVDDDYF